MTGREHTPAPGETPDLLEVHGDHITYNHTGAAAGPVALHGDHVVVNSRTDQDRQARIGDAPIPDVPGYELRPEPLQAQTPAEFMSLLRELRLWSGQPSYRTMARRCGRSFGASTLCTALKQDTLPKQEILKAIIVSLGGDDDVLSAWVTAWRRLILGQNHVVRPRLSIVHDNRGSSAS